MIFPVQRWKSSDPIASIKFSSYNDIINITYRKKGDNYPDYLAITQSFIYFTVKTVEGHDDVFRLLHL